MTETIELQEIQNAQVPVADVEGNFNNSFLIFSILGLVVLAAEVYVYFEFFLKEKMTNNSQTEQNSDVELGNLASSSEV